MATATELVAQYEQRFFQIQQLAGIQAKRAHDLSVELKNLKNAAQRVYAAAVTQAPALANAPVFVALHAVLGLPQGQLDWDEPIESDNDLYTKAATETSQRVQALRNLTGASLELRRSIISQLKALVDSEYDLVAPPTP